HVSEYLGINKSYFCSIFKNETGKTFTQFLNEKRIEKSKKLLREDNLSILDIALSVGFNNQNYYNIIFKRITNTTPLEYRKKVSAYYIKRCSINLFKFILHLLIFVFLISSISYYFY